MTRPGSFIDPLFNWTSVRNDGNECHVKGWFRREGQVFKRERAAKEIISLLAKENELKAISGIIKDLKGNFSFILESPSNILASVDKIRSYPVFYTNEGSGFYVSNSAQLLQKEMQLYEKDPDRLIEFQMSGYVGGPFTLFKKMRQLQAGECLCFNKEDAKIETRRYYIYYSEENNKKSERELIDELAAVTRKTFEEMIGTLNGRKVWIPLSGGLDSRLVLGMLSDLKYDNVATYTYGIPQLWEIKWAKKVSEYAGVEWHYIPYVPGKVKNYYHTQERESYFNFASGLSSLPFFTEFYALAVLRRRNLIDQESILINGQSGDFLTGGHIPKALETFEETYIPIEFMLQYFIDKHYSLWLNLKSLKNKSLIKDNILKALKCSKEILLEKSEVARLYELYEWQERQSKYVVNGQRMYDWFGIDWRLPLWCDELMLFWQNIPWHTKISQRLYKKYLQIFDPGKLFNREMPKKKDYIPLVFKPIYILHLLFSKKLRLDSESFKRKYIDYYWVYSPFYPQKNYLKYLSDSKYHRNYLSYYVKDFISSLNSMN